MPRNFNLANSSITLNNTDLAEANLVLQSIGNKLYFDKQELAGASSLTLQDVTDNGNVTTNDISVAGLSASGNVHFSGLSTGVEDHAVFINTSTNQLFYNTITSGGPSTDTLDDVCGRGNTTGLPIAIGGLTSTGGTVTLAESSGSYIEINDTTNNITIDASSGGGDLILSSLPYPFNNDEILVSTSGGVVRRSGLSPQDVTDSITGLQGQIDTLDSTVNTSINLQYVTDRGNTTTNTVEFQNPTTALSVIENSKIQFESNIAIHTGSATGRINLGLNAGETGQGINAIALGYQAGQTGQNSYSTALGYLAGQTGQGGNSIALGTLAGQTGQGGNSIALGASAGYSGQGEYAVALGNSVGFTNQGDEAVALGHAAGYSGQGQDSVAIGYQAGQTSQGQDSVAIGQAAGQNGQGSSAVAIGLIAGLLNQEAGAVAIGSGAGRNNQGENSIAIGWEAGNNDQDISTIAIGLEAGENGQNTFSISIGDKSGKFGQGSNCVALGADSGKFGQGLSSVAVGYQAGEDNQGEYSTSVGRGAGRTEQGNSTVAVGYAAGENGQNVGSVSIGYWAGRYGQGDSSVALGPLAGQTAQGQKAIAIGDESGLAGQNNNSVAIGYRAGKSAQYSGSVALGYLAGELGQGENSVAIGYLAGRVGQQDNTIVLNATNSAVNGSTNSDSTYIKPIRNTTHSNVLSYDEQTGELGYARTIDVNQIQMTGTSPIIQSFTGSNVVQVSTRLVVSNVFSEASLDNEDFMIVGNNGTVGESVGSNIFLRICHYPNDSANPDIGIKLVENSSELGFRLGYHAIPANDRFFIRSRDKFANLNEYFTIRRDTTDESNVIGNVGISNTNPTNSLSIGSNVHVNVEGTTKVFLFNLPTGDPGVSGQLWNDSGTLKISA